MFLKTSQRPCSAATVRGPFLKVKSPVSLHTYVPTRFLASKVSSSVTTMKLRCFWPIRSLNKRMKDILPHFYVPFTTKCFHTSFCISLMVSSIFFPIYEVSTRLLSPTLCSSACYGFALNKSMSISGQLDGTAVGLPTMSSSAQVATSILSATLMPV